jgi:CubicO group peptidase (beta-lactamase class C family)
MEAFMRRREFLGAAVAGGVLASQAAGRADLSLEEMISQKLGGADFGGTILVARGRDPILRRGYGLADRAFGVPCAPDTTYRIASITKLFTAVLVMRSRERGRIDLDATIATYLPDYRGPAAAKASIRQLLNHTSGIANFDEGNNPEKAARRGIPAYQLPHTPRELLDRYASGALVHEPGRNFDYNNADYVILGLILEAVEGVPFDRVLSREIVEPLGLKATGMANHARIIPRLAPSYFKYGDAPLANEFPLYPENWYAAGGMYSTVDDLMSFADAFYRGRLIGKDGLSEMLKPGLDEYGFGQWVTTHDVDGRKRRATHRPGRILGTCTVLIRMPDDDLTVIILANTNLVDTDDLGVSIARHVLHADAS